MNALHLAVLTTALSACSAGTDPVASVVSGGDPDHGATIIRDVGCGSCHTIPGIRAAEGVVGPPLYFFSRRTFIAGKVPNTPVNLVRWLRDPQSVVPGSGMPDVGLDEQQARDVAAYLYSLR